jgi:hypothetical protein
VEVREKKGPNRKRRHGAGKIKKKSSVNSGIGLDPGEKREKINLRSKEGEKKYQGSNREGSSKGTGEKMDPIDNMREEGSS